jgi:hypothetical protein
MFNSKVFFRVIDSSQGNHIGSAELKYWSDTESATEAIKFYCDTHNKHFGTNWQLYKIDEVLL